VGAHTVIQLSDLHITAAGDLHGQDPRANLDRVLADIARRGIEPDLVVATGDLADDGDPEAYAWLQSRLRSLGVPVYCLAGNHDREPAFTRDLPGPGVHVDPVADVGEWRFVFLDTNARGQVLGASGEREDDGDRRHRARVGALFDTDADWLRATLAEAAGRPVMVWVHHPPVAHPAFVGLDTGEYPQLLAEVAAAAGNVRGVAAGHVHSSHDEARDGVRYFTCPSGWLTLDLDGGTLAPPGYREYRFHADGRIDATTHWVDDGLGPERNPFPDWVLTVLAAGG